MSTPASAVAAAVAHFGIGSGAQLSDLTCSSAAA
jgi:hypothetical protein